MSDSQVPAPAKPTSSEETKPSQRGGMESILPTIKMTALSIAVALVIGALLIAVSDKRVVGADSVGAAFKGVFTSIGGSYWALLTGSVGSWNSIANTLVQSAPLICAGLGVTLAFRAGLFNIGGQGQLVLGSIVGGYAGFQWHLPVGLHVLVVLVMAVAGGALWGGIAGLLKAKTGAHEVITTIMLNYVAASLLLYLLANVKSFQRPGESDPRSMPVDNSATFPTVAGVHLGVLLAFGAAVLLWWILNRTTLGFQLKAAGANPNASRTAGMSVAGLYFLAMLIAGGLSGLGGAMQIQGQHLSLTSTFAGSLGFDAITVALLGRATPLGTVLAGLLFGALNAGGREMMGSQGTPIQLTEVITALIVLFVAAPAAVRGLLRLKGPAQENATLAAKGWGA